MSDDFSWQISLPSLKNQDQLCIPEVWSRGSDSGGWAEDVYVWDSECSQPQNETGYSFPTWFKADFQQYIK